MIYLFQNNAYTLSIHLLSWNVNYKVNVDLVKSNTIKGTFLFASSNHTNNWKVSLVAANSFNQSADITIDLLIK